MAVENYFFSSKKITPSEKELGGGSSVVSTGGGIDRYVHSGAFSGSTNNITLKRNGESDLVFSLDGVNAAKLNGVDAISYVRKDLDSIIEANVTIIGTGNKFSGDGSGLTNVDADKLDGVAAGAYAKTLDLSPVAISGDYNDLINTPTTVGSGDISNWNAAYNDKINSIAFDTANGVVTFTQQDVSVLTVDLDGRYRTSAQTLGFTSANGQLSIVDGNTISLDGRYVLIGGNISTLNNDSGYITQASLAPVATSNSYTDLINTPSNLAYTNVDNNFSVSQTINGALTVDTSTNRMLRLDGDFGAGFTTKSIYRQGVEMWREILNSDNEYEIWSEEGGASTRFKILQNGNILIGGSGTPTERLDVDGNVKATSFIGSGASLTGVNADQLNGVDAINYARTDVAETFNANVTIGVGSTISGNGSGLTNLDADTLDGVAAGAYITSASLSPVATSGDYTDLINTPSNLAYTNVDNEFSVGQTFNNKIFGGFNGFATANQLVFQIQDGSLAQFVDSTGTGSILVIRDDKTIQAFSSITATSFIGSGASLTGVDADQLNGVDAINYARTDVAETFNANVTIGVGAIISGNGSGLTNIDADTLGGVAAGAYAKTLDLAPVATSNSYTDLINTPPNLAYTNVNNNFTADQTINGQVTIEGVEKQLRFNSGGKFFHIRARSSGAWAEFNTDLDYYRFMSKPVEIDHSLVVDGNASVTTLNGVNPSLFRTTAQELSFNSGNGQLTIVDGNTVDLDSRYLPAAGTIDADTLSGRAIGTFYGTGVGQIALPVTLAYVNQDNSFTTNQTISGNVTATSFFGSGANLTGVAKTGVNNNFTADQTIYGALRVENDGNFVGLRLHNTISGRPTLIYFDASNQLNIWAAGTGTGTEGLIRFMIGSGSGTEVMRVNNDQKVFIGQTTGTEKLEVNGTAKMTSLLTSAPSGKTAYKWKFGNPSLNAVKLITDNSLWVEVNGTVYQLALVEPDLS